MNPESEYKSRLNELRAESRLRVIPQSTSPRIDLCSNDYLGLAAKGDILAEEFMDTHPRLDFSSSASRLLSRRQDAHNALETTLRELYLKPALLFNSGYHANVGAISALAIPGTVFIADRLAHASMIDGLTLSRKTFERFRHNDMNHLRKLLEKHADADRIIVIAESIYSMDGDTAPLHHLIALKKDFPNMMLYLDEAHGFGVRGNRGLGLVEEMGVIEQTDIIVGTFGKAAASSGAFICTSKTLHDWLLNTARSFIFSTALPPLCMDYTRFIISKIIGMKNEREHLRYLSQWFSDKISNATGQKCSGESQIIPWITGNSRDALSAAKKLQEAGFDVLPIRRPTVPPGGERIRFSLNASLSKSDLEGIRFEI
ncbi:MAG: 8-amino-7-oxononanoate synthase [Prevotella sp.]|nr:8-amino-7-oxononanoate synthase [Bacteroides sp.]MCM1366598.1 8-amino-7-oxononanoate synthase [Prevotella sp.]MCM1437305.1 8-amino-7-oxononanoate synthase [Prevotella sp.]